MSRQISKVWDSEGRLTAVAEWEEEDLFENPESDNRDLRGGIWDGDLPPLPKLPKCKPCRVCGQKHYSRCHICPHKNTIASYKNYEDSPCSDCSRPSESLKNGHGKVFVFDSDKHGKAYIPQEPIESDENYVAILDTLRGFASLTPQEFSAFILTKYFSKTYLQAGKELEAEFRGTFGKNKVVSLLESAEEKLAEVLHAGAILRGKVMGTGSEGK